MTRRYHWRTNQLNPSMHHNEMLQLTHLPEDQEEAAHSQNNHSVQPCEERWCHHQLAYSQTWTKHCKDEAGVSSKLAIKIYGWFRDQENKMEHAAATLCKASRFNNQCSTSSPPESNQKASSPWSISNNANQVTRRKQLNKKFYSFRVHTQQPPPPTGVLSPS